MTPEDFEKSIVEQVEDLRRLPNETGWAEFKVNTVTEPEKIGEYLSALANSATLEHRPYGFIVWGISDGKHEVVGTKFRVEQAKKGNENLQNWLVRAISPQPDLLVKETTVQGKPVSLIRISCAKHQPTDFQDVPFIRVGSHVKPLKKHPEKQRLLWRAFDTTPFEKHVAAERVDGTAALGLLDYPAYFELDKRPLPEDRNGILEALADEDLVRRRPGDKWDILNLGAILFATDLNEFPSLKRKAVRVIQYDGTSRAKALRERSLDKPKGYASGFEQLIEYLMAILPENEVIRKALRTRVRMYPEEAIRELVPNALIHQDFFVTGAGPMIEVFSNRLEVTNPGQSLVEIPRLLDSPPKSRNDALASLARRLNMAEERGSGIDKVVTLTEVFQLPAPLFEAPGDNTRATLFAHQPFDGMDRDDLIRAAYLHASLLYVNGRRLTNASLRERFGVEGDKSAKISRIIGNAVSDGLIKPYGAGTGTRNASYVPAWA